MKKNTIGRLLAIAATCTPVGFASGAVIVSESFAGSGVALNGTTTDSGPGLTQLTWTAGPGFLDDGSVAAIPSGSPTGQSAFLPFSGLPAQYANGSNPAAGFIYRLSATVSNAAPEWLAVGFSTNGNNSTAQDFSVRHSNSGAYAWVLTRSSAGNDQEAFNGPGTSNGVPAASGDLANPTLPVMIDIVLDTTGTDWTASYFYNGTQAGTTQTLAAGAATAITGFGFSRTSGGSASITADLSSLTLDVVPEPSVALLSAFGLAGLLRRRRS